MLRFNASDGEMLFMTLFPLYFHGENKKLQNIYPVSQIIHDSSWHAEQKKELH